MNAVNSEIPLRLWIDASRNPALPAYLQRRVAQSGWFRAVMLSRFDDAKQLLRRVVELDPGAADTANAFLAAGDQEELRFAARFIYLRSPGLSPVLGDASLENETLGRPHVSRRCPEIPPAPKSFPAFLTGPDREAASNEVQRLIAGKAWHATLSLRHALDWANKHPADLRVPEALHRAVLMSFYGCKDEETGKYSEQAFKLLHTRYAATRWALDTKYWYR